MRRLIRSLFTLALSAASLAALVLVLGAQPQEVALITALPGFAPAQALASAPQAPLPQAPATSASQPD